MISNDYAQPRIAETVSDALKEAKEQLEKVSENASKKSYEYSHKYEKDAKKDKHDKKEKAYKAVTAPRVKIKKVGSVAGVLFQVFGGIGTGIFGLLSFIFLIGNFIEGRYWGLSILLGIMTAICGGMIVYGTSKQARLKRADRYVQVMQGKSYINLSELALLANQSEAYVRKDVKKMIQMGIFPEGHLDAEEKCLIIGDVAYREYIRLAKARKAARAEAEEHSAK